MRKLLIIGLIVVALGLASLFVPIPRRERHGFDAGPVSFGIETTSRQVVPWPVSAVIIVAGVVLIVISARRKR